MQITIAMVKYEGYMTMLYKADETWSKQKSGLLSLKAGQRIFAQQGQKGQRQKGTFDP